MRNRRMCSISPRQERALNRFIDRNIASGRLPANTNQVLSTPDGRAQLLDYLGGDPSAATAMFDGDPTPAPKGGRLLAFLSWLLANQDGILAFIKAIVALFGGTAAAPTSAAQAA